MRYAHVGSSGLELSRLVLGMMSFGDHSQRAWHLDADAARPLVRRAAEAGVTAYDTADVYVQNLEPGQTTSQDGIFANAPTNPPATAKPRTTASDGLFNTRRRSKIAA